ncbi:MAG: NUDIX domain-containing protein [Candidatus Promineifilaceae bacterium]
MMFQSLAQIPVEERWHGQPYPLPVVAAIIRRDALSDNSKTHFLLIRRNSNPYQGMWALVGGKWDFGETLAQAIIREVEEETGLETAFVALKGLVNERLATLGDADGSPAHFLIFVCELLITAGTAEEQAEGEVAWFSTAEIELLHQKGAIVPSDYRMMEQFAESAALPYSEAEMAVDGLGIPDLKRFEESVV